MEDYKISKKSKDIIQKYVSSAFKNVSLDFYGIQAAKIKELINVELPIIDINDNSTDFVFLLEDNTYLHLEFQTVYNKNDLIRFLTYDARLYLRDKRKIHTVVVYAANVKNVDILDMGSNVFKPTIVLLKGYDGDSIYKEIENKISNDAELTDLDIINLLFLPLMKNKKNKAAVASDSIKLAQHITDKNKRNICVGSIFAFAYKYLNELEINKILEVLKMTDIGTMLMEKAVKERDMEIVRKALLKGIDVKIVSEITDLEIEVIEKIKEELNK